VSAHGTGFAKTFKPSSRRLWLSQDGDGPRAEGDTATGRSVGRALDGERLDDSLPGWPFFFDQTIEFR
jgi:hypothetical protein